MQVKLTRKIKEAIDSGATASQLVDHGLAANLKIAEGMVARFNELKYKAEKFHKKLADKSSEAGQ